MSWMLHVILNNTLFFVPNVSLIPNGLDANELLFYHS